MDVPRLSELIDETEVAWLMSRYGPSRRLHISVTMNEAEFAYWWQKLVQQRNRRGEVVLAIQRTDGNVLLHTKSFYPAGLYRLPTGGVLPWEKVLFGARREAKEETGCDIRVMRLAGIITYHFHNGGRHMPFVSYVLLARSDDIQPAIVDTEEHISDFRFIPPSQLRHIAETLRQLGGPLAGWGAFRAPPHDLVADALDA
jgi:8-oxo-dGTP pyrophosphatase MutT (NUDIX family)